MDESLIKKLSQGFSKLNRNERFAKLQQMGLLTKDDIDFLTESQGISIHLAENFIENALGYFQLPLGVAMNFCIDGRDYVIPMAVEETSIIAAASKTAKWIRENGRIITQAPKRLAIGQIQIPHVQDYRKLCDVIEEKREFLIESVNHTLLHNMQKRGGGMKTLSVRKLARSDGGDMAVIHVYIDTCDAMGANIITQVCEHLKTPIETLSGEQVNMCILSNLPDTSLTRARVEVDIDAALADKIVEASIFANTDPYRAATHNKGVLNAIDPILIATGNDWRAVEAGVHAYAARDGQYRSITEWRYENNQLIGELTAPIAVGVVGGVTRLHPTAKLCLQMMGIESAARLSQICAAVGLVQNLGAIKALTTNGFIRGHMKLHISNLTIEAGAKDKEIPILKQHLEAHLAQHNEISLSHAVELLAKLREDDTKDNTLIQTH